MDEKGLPLAAISSIAAFAVFSEEKRLLVSEHEDPREAFSSLKAYVLKEPLGDAAIYERGESWRCVVRCPEDYDAWLARLKEKIKKRTSAN